MKNFIYELLSSSGKVSSTRFVFVLGHIVTFVLVAFLVFTQSVNTLNLSLISLIVGTLSSTKLVQKSQEKSSQSPQKPLGDDSTTV